MSVCVPERCSLTCHASWISSSWLFNFIFIFVKWMKLQGGKFGEWSSWLVKIVLAYPSSCVLCWLMLVSTTVFFFVFFTSDISEQADCNNRSGEPLHSQKCWKRNDKHAPGLTPHQTCCLWVKKLDSPIENCSVIDGGFCSLAKFLNGKFVSL